MTATKQFGVSKDLRRVLASTTATVVLFLISASALAQNVLQDVRYASAPGGKVDITLQFSGPVGEVQAFTTDSPPRSAIDLPGTKNGLATRRVAVGSGATSAVSAAEAGGRTRVVVDLFRPAGYTTRSAGNTLVLTVDAGSSASSASTAMASPADPSKRTANTVNVTNIDFRRGDNGAGRVIMRFSSDQAAADMRNEGHQVVVDVSNATIPENLRRRLDVTDFATPVVSLEPRSNAGGTRLVVDTEGEYETMAYQTGNEYVLEIAPKRGTVIAANGTRAPGAAGQVVTTAAPQRYSGKPVTFNFQDVPVRTVLQLIAEESNLNIVAADTVSGNVTLRLINVPWDQALQIVLRAKGLDMRRDGNVVWVAPQKELADYEQALNTARINLENSCELVSEYIAINYGRAEDIAGLLTETKSGQTGGGGGATQSQAGAQRGFLSPRGTVSFDNRTNTLLVVDCPRQVSEIRNLLLTVDRPVDQVLIEARIVVADENFARDLGARLGVSNPNENANSISNISGNIEANSATMNSIVNTNHANAQLPPGTVGELATITQGFLTNLAVPNAAGSIAFSILRSSSLLDLELSALETDGRGEIISNPRVITSNQREAVIRQGDEIGYTTTNSTAGGNTGVATTTVQFKEALLELKVTPTITSDGRVYLALEIKKDDIKSFISTQSGQVPSFTKRFVSTAVLIDNGQTVVVGGVYEFRSRDDVTKVPWLGDVPFLGRLFKKTGRSNSKAELLIFVTPRVLQVSRR
jgi:type IV pilus assembly protein PilQ